MRAVSPNYFRWFLAVIFLSACASHAAPAPDKFADLASAIGAITNQFAPDSHAAICRIEIEQDGDEFVLTGDVQDPAAKQAALDAAKKLGIKVDNEIDVLPQPSLGSKVWGIATLSVVNVREKPANGAEMGTQMLTGEALRVWKRQGNWYLVQTSDGYVGWAEAGGFASLNTAGVEEWNAAPLLIVTNFEERILEKPESGAQAVSDVVMGSRVKKIGESGGWYQIALADGRAGYVPKTSVTDYAAWRASRNPTPENIERTAKLFLGRPYSWGCNSVRGMDCSGLTKFVFFLNGIDLRRNASEQCLQGTEVPLTDDFAHLKKGDLLFFGRSDRRGRGEHVNHTAIYLGNKLFIQSAEMVKISSLDPDSSIGDIRHVRGLLHARRILPESTTH